MSALETYVKFAPTVQLERDLRAAVRNATSEDGYSNRERTLFLEDAKILMAELERRYQA